MSRPAASEPVIRPAANEDLGRIAAIYGHYVEHTYTTFEIDPPTAEQWSLKWEVAKEHNQPWLVSERGGELQGYAAAVTFNPRPAYRFTVETSIYLKHEVVGQGLGRRLYECLLAEAARRAFHLAVAGIALPNERSVALHESLSFRRVGVFREVGYKLGDWRDVGWWQRPL
jgi:L-amino acid N-acyltransferase YncA